MSKLQQLGKDAATMADQKKVQPQSENFQLNNTNEEQQFGGGIIKELAYDAIDHHITYQRTQYSYNEEYNKYTEAAFNDYSQITEDGAALYQPQSSGQTAALPDPVGRLTGDSSGRLPGGPPPSVPTPPSDGLLSGTSHKYNDEISIGTAEVPELWANAEKLMKNVQKTERLDDKRKFVQREYNGFSLKTEHREIATKARLKFNYYGKIRLSEDRIELLHIGRLKYEGQVVREKMNRKDYNDRRAKKEKKAFKRRAAGRLLFRKGHALLNDESIEEDENIASLKRAALRTGRATTLNVRQSIKTLRLQNNVYARYEQAKHKNQVLQNKREKIYAKSDKAMRRQQLKEAQTRKQKHEMKKKMAQRRVREEGNFFQRTKHQFMVKKTAKEYRSRVVKRTLSTIWSAAVIVVIGAMLLMFLLLIILMLTEGSAEYYASAVTQNDYSTISDATSYFRKLETDLDEYLNADRDALEADLEAAYGPDIYEYIYSLADFGFSANTLIAYLSAMYGSFSLADIQAELQSIFNEMYTLTIEVKLEDREIQVYNPDTAEYDTVTMQKKICYVTLEKKELEEVVESRLPEDLKFQYNAYHLSTGGQQVYSPVMREDWTNLISSNYGERIHPITKVRTFHKGVDIAVPTGTKLYSAVKGVVVTSRYSDSAGHMVTIQTDSGWKVTFMHMDSRAVSAGDIIEQGDFVGFSGNSGNSTGPHLHLQVENEEGNTVNPIFIIPQTCAATGEEE